MGILGSALDSFGGILQDQWKDVVTARPFNEHSVVVPGYRKRSQDGRGANRGSGDILSNGSIIYVPEGTACFVFSQAGIERIIPTPGGYEYRDGELSVFNEQDRREAGMGKILVGQAVDRFGFSGMSAEEKRVAFVNLREIRGLKFGTRGPLAYNDLYYGCDLEVYSFGTFSVQVTDPVRFVRSFVPANCTSYTFDNPKARTLLLSEFLHSFIAAVNSLSESFRISQLPSQANAIKKCILEEEGNAGTWDERFGLRLVSLGIENIEFSDESRELVRKFADRKMSVRAYEGVSQSAGDMAAQQIIAEGVRENGLGDAGGMLFGMGLAGSLNPQNAASAGIASGVAAGMATQPQQHASSETSAPSTAPMPVPGNDDPFETQIKKLKKYKELLDAGVISQDEFEAKRRELLEL